MSPNGKPSFGYDELNRNATAQNPLAEGTTFDYDENGNQTAIIAPGGEVTYYGYDRQTATSQPASDSSDSSDWSYAAAGNQTAATNPGGHVTYFAYDALDRLSSETDPIGNGPRSGRLLP